MTRAFHMSSTSSLLRRSTLAVAASIGMMSIAACGASGEGGQDEAFNVALLSDATGAASFYGLHTNAGLKAKLDEVNAAGGVDGHAIEYGSINDAQSSAAGTASAVRTALTSEPSLLLGYALSSNLVGSASVLDSAKVPFVTSTVVDQWLPPAKSAKPWFYTLQATGPQQMSSALEKAEELVGPLEGKKIAVVAWSIASFDAYVDYLRESESEYGYELAPILRTEATTPSFAVQASKIVSSDADVVISMVAGSDAPVLAKALKLAGYDGPVLGSTAVNAPTIVSTIADENYHVFREAPMPNDAMLDAARKAKVDDYTESPWFTDGWNIGEVAVAVLEECGYPCSAADASKVMQDMKPLDVGESAYGPLDVAAQSVLTKALYVTWDAAGKKEDVSGTPQDIATDSQ